MNFQIIILLLVLIKISIQIGPLVKFECSKQYNATTNNLKNIFLGRCYYFLNILHKTSCNINEKNYDCDLIWSEFSSVIIGKDPCSIKLSDFDRLLEITDHPIGNSSTLFWSGTYTSAHDLSKTRNYWSLEDTFIGYLFNELTFCSRSGNLDFSYDYCPFDCIISNSQFWNAASINFAKKAFGKVSVVLNGSRSFGAVSNRSTFVKYELPQLTSAKITQVKVLLVHAPDQPIYETCKQPKTLIYLENVLKSKEIEYLCEDNPDNILLLMCFYDPLSKECQSIKYLLNNSFSDKIFSKLEKFTVSLICFILINSFLF